MKIKKQWIEAQNYRVSRRAYIKKQLEKQHIDNLNKLIKEINNESGLNFQLLEDCSNLFKGFSASYGMIKGLKSCIALVGNKNIENFKNKVGYYGEMLVLEATDMKLGTCWIGGTYDKKECENYININKDEELVCVIAIGYNEDNKSFKEKLVSRLNKGRKSFDEILLEKDLEIQDWVEEGINSVIKAPSALNKQPFGYSFKDNVVTAYTTKENHGFEDVDLGISMLHFKLGAISMGHDGNWEYINGENIYK
jgi:hypothetical protein